MISSCNDIEDDSDAKRIQSFYARGITRSDLSGIHTNIPLKANHHLLVASNIMPPEVIVSEADLPWQSHGTGLPMHLRTQRSIRKQDIKPIPDYHCEKCGKEIPRKDIPYHECNEGHLPSQFLNTCVKCGKFFEKGPNALRCHQSWCYSSKKDRKRRTDLSAAKHIGHFTMSEERRKAWQAVSIKMTGIKRSYETRLKHSQTKRRLYSTGKLVPWNKGLSAEKYTQHY